ncbi:signal transduction histidine kinase [Thermoflavifilum aggregans]|uniref:histidine kinase n=1 Tax=Thermoflavifilum aggregans TaxID=454188 RepID=A0A2M9CV90_9BACT|nr:ATP-binding protein [Thermoflavifilum aggregans]PJJ75834.1 signal transduction histidine kinase [Thermoflavifilum aggregans]
MSIKSKLLLGLGFLLCMILLVGIIAIYDVSKMIRNTHRIIQDNYESLNYCNQMLQSVNDYPITDDQIHFFQQALEKEKHNFTEPGESQAVKTVDSLFQLILANPNQSSFYSQIRLAINRVYEINQLAISRKYHFAQQEARQIKIWFISIFLLMLMLSIGFIFWFTHMINKPFIQLQQAIRKIANKDYNVDISMQRQDEFGKLALDIRHMASRLKEYENSNLAQIKTEKKRIEVLIQNFPDPLMVIDENQYIVFANDEALRVLNLEKSIIGSKLEKLIPENDILRDIFNHNISSYSVENSILNICVDQKESYFEVKRIKVKGKFTDDDDELHMGEIIILKDITAYKKLDLAKTNFIATISHQLKTPVTSMLLSLKLVQEDRDHPLNEDQMALVRGMQDDCQSMLNILAEILKFTQLESGKIDVTLQRHSPSEILKYALHAVKLQADQKHIDIDLQLPDQLPDIMCDGEKTAWVLINLISNAIRYSREGSRIEITLQEQKQELIWRIADQGPGIAKEYLEKIFQHYFRVPQLQQEGTGLGLAISREFIEAQGGKIWAESELGVGSTFYFSLKIA